MNKMKHIYPIIIVLIVFLLVSGTAFILFWDSVKDTHSMLYFTSEYLFSPIEISFKNGLCRKILSSIFPARISQMGLPISYKQTNPLPLLLAKEMQTSNHFRSLLADY